MLLAGGTLSLGAAAWAAAARRVHCRVCVNRWWRPWPHRVVSFVKLPSVTSFGSSAPTALFYYFSIYWLRGLALQLYTQGTWGMRKRPPPVVPWFGVKRQLRQQHAFFYLPLLALRYSTFQFHVQRPGHRGRDPQLLSLRWLVTWTWERVVNWRRPRPNFDVWLRCYKLAWLSTSFTQCSLLDYISLIKVIIIIMSLQKGGKMQNDWNSLIMFLVPRRIF